MTGKPDDIPQDVWGLALAAVENCDGDPVWYMEIALARAIMAERAKTVDILTECYDLLEIAPLESEVKLSGILPRIAAIIGKGTA